MMHREIKTRKARRRKVTIDFIELNNNSLVFVETLSRLLAESACIHIVY